MFVAFGGPTSHGQTSMFVHVIVCLSLQCHNVSLWLLVIEEVQSHIEGVYRQYEELYKSKDAAGIASLYTEDCQFLPPNRPLLRGRQGED
ncbi:hypothetical protein CEE45_16475 [Candidatus Heimdallarchaeota archaeon B3_Heim]|nr:MAG: hypothetical protein CEE45_16475 [Candidatus Heimdallarchaeota archaeon B3_Heim]